MYLGESELVTTFPYTQYNTLYSIAPPNTPMASACRLAVDLYGGVHCIGVFRAPTARIVLVQLAWEASVNVVKLGAIVLVVT